MIEKILIGFIIIVIIVVSYSLLTKKQGSNDSLRDYLDKNYGKKENFDPSVYSEEDVKDMLNKYNQHKENLKKFGYEMCDITYNKDKDKNLNEIVSKIDLSPMCFYFNDKNKNYKKLNDNVLASFAFMLVERLPRQYKDVTFVYDKDKDNITIDSNFIKLLKDTIDNEKCNTNNPFNPIYQTSDIKYEEFKKLLLNYFKKYDQCMKQQDVSQMISYLCNNSICPTKSGIPMTPKSDLKSSPTPTRK